MRDKRPVDELSIEELEHILAIRKREERQGKLKRMERAGRVVPSESAKSSAPVFPVLNFPDAQSTAASSATASAATPSAKIDTASSLPASPTPQFEDDARAVNANSYKKPANANPDRFWKTFVNQSTLLVEVLAIAGLAYLGFQMFTATNSLQKETASAQALANQQRSASIPTLAPTLQLELDDFVLPGGHIFTASGEARFNYDEVPSNLIGLVQSQILQPVIARPQETEETAILLNIPKLNIQQSIVQGTDWEALKLGVGQLLNGVTPGGESGNLVLSGHDDIYGEVFRYIDQLAAGDEFTVRTRTKVYTYRVTGQDIVDPNDVHVLDPRGGATVTLLSCYPYKVNNKRIVVYAERVGTV
ncbi:MAG: sortase [Chloroflexota bacterium]